MKFVVPASQQFAVIVIMILISSAFYGCASVGPLMGSDQLTVDKASTNKVKIGRVHVRRTVAGMDITGNVKLTRRMIGTPTGGVLITIIDPAGKVMYKSQADYYRYGKPVKPSDTFNFSLTIPIVAPKGSIVRLETESAL